MLAKIKRINVRENRRMIAVSDIHGNLNGLKKLLEKVGFNKEDYLFFAGDMIEKGPQSLKTLRYIMQLSKTHNVHAVCGNCDSVAAEIYDDRKHREILTYLLRRRKSLLNEMCESLSIRVSKETDMRLVKEALNRNYREELEWISNLPDIIDTQEFTFVHAGLSSGDLEHQTAERVRSTDAFLKQGLYLDKYCVVGHWPVILYSEAIPSCNPIVDKERKIISIDGGNVLKRNGQLNAFIIPDIHSQEFAYVSQDDLKTGIITDSQEEISRYLYIPWTPGRQRREAEQDQKDSMLIHWIDNKIKILEREEEFSYCEHCSTKHQMWILNKYIYREKDGYHCEDSTDYRIPVKTGDRVSVIEVTANGCLIKKDGITGWYFGKIKTE